jgi:hypothetical protein
LEVPKCDRTRPDGENGVLGIAFPIEGPIESIRVSSIVNERSA